MADAPKATDQNLQDKTATQKDVAKQDRKDTTKDQLEQAPVKEDVNPTATPGALLAAVEEQQEKIDEEQDKKAKELKVQHPEKLAKEQAKEQQKAAKELDKEGDRAEREERKELQEQRKREREEAKKRQEEYEERGKIIPHDKSPNSEPPSEAGAPAPKEGETK